MDERRPAAVTSRSSSSSSSSSLVDGVRALVEALLLERVRLVLVADGKSAASLRLYLFGTRHRFDHVYVPSALLSCEESEVIEYLAIMSAYWVADEGDVESVRASSRSDDDARGDTLVASALLNDAFELALDRVALVWAACDTLLYGAGEYERVRHVLEAALLSTASLPGIISAGYYNALCHLAHSVHTAPFVPASRAAARYTPDAVAFAREYAARHGVVTVRFEEWQRSIVNL